MKLKFIIIFLFFGSTISFSQDYKLVSIKDVQEVIKSRNDTLYVLNFWANWSKDCEKELPYFDNLSDNFSGKKIKVILICVDQMQDKEKWVLPFLNKMQLKSEIWWLDVDDINLHKSEINRNWVDEIPFTLIFRGKTYEKFWRNGKWKEDKLIGKVEEMY